MVTFERLKEYVSVPILMLILSVSLSVLLAREVVVLRQELKREKEKVYLSIGDNVSPFVLEDLEGNTKTIKFDETQNPTVLYVFSPDCHWCLQNFENLLAVVERANGSHRFVGISLTKNGLSDYISQSKFPFDVFINTDPELPRKMGFGATPQTLIISNNGKVLKNWKGAYKDEMQVEVENYFNIKLPGLSEKNIR